MFDASAVSPIKIAVGIRNPQGKTSTVTVTLGQYPGT